MTVKKRQTVENLSREILTLKEKVREIDPLKQKVLELIDMIKELNTKLKSHQDEIVN